MLVLDTASDDAERLYRRQGWQYSGTIPDYALMPDGAFCATHIFYKMLKPGSARPRGRSWRQTSSARTAGTFAPSRSFSASCQLLSRGQIPDAATRPAEPSSDMRKRFEKETHDGWYVFIAASMLAIFVVDLQTQIGVATWLFYLIPLGACIFLTRPDAPLLVAAVVDHTDHHRLLLFAGRRNGLGTAQHESQLRDRRGLGVRISDRAWPSSRGSRCAKMTGCGRRSRRFRSECSASCH